MDPDTANVAIYDALNMADADGDGIKDTDAYGCSLTTITDTVEPVDNQTIDPDADDDWTASATVLTYVQILHLEV